MVEDERKLSQPLNVFYPDVGMQPVVGLYVWGRLRAVRVRMERI